MDISHALTDLRGPVLRLPFPSRINRRVEHIGAHLDTWVRDCVAAPAGQQELWREARVDLMTARMYPQAGPEHLDRIAESVMWLFVLDDYFDPGGAGDDPAAALALARRVPGLLDGVPTPLHDPVLRSLAHMRDGLRPRVDPTWWSSFAAQMSRFVATVAQEVGARRGPAPADVEAYVRHRRTTSGWPLLTAMTELAGDAVLPDPVRGSPQHRAATDAAGDVVCTVNDLLSLPKEMAAGEVHNLVLVIGREQGVGHDAAFALAQDHLSTRLTDYLRDEVRLLDHPAAAGDPALKALLARYAEGLRHLMRGNLDWSIESGRYRTAPPTHEELA